MLWLQRPPWSDPPCRPPGHRILPPPPDPLRARNNSGFSGDNYCYGGFGPRSIDDYAANYVISGGDVVHSALTECQFCCASELGKCFDLARMTPELDDDDP